MEASGFGAEGLGTSCLLRRPYFSLGFCQNNTYKAAVSGA